MTKTKLKNEKNFKIHYCHYFHCIYFVKAIDVKGFSFKLEEYFSPDVFNLTFTKFHFRNCNFVVALELDFRINAFVENEAKMHAYFVNCIVRFLCISHVLFVL